MRIIVAHARYRQRGGEDVVAESEVDLLRAHGQTVETYFRENEDLVGQGKIQLLKNTIWSSEAANDLERKIMEFRPDIIHCHNTFPALSPSVYWVADKYHIPVVQTLHNFRLLCPKATLYREGHPCEDCVGKTPMAGIVHACYQDSRQSTVAIAAMLMAHRVIGTWTRKVSRFVALNDFCKEIFVRGGLPLERIDVKPNFVETGMEAYAGVKSGFLYVGRLSEEKGPRILAEAVKQIGQGVEVSVIGDGPDKSFIQNVPGIKYLGRRPRNEVFEAMSRAAVVIVPSICYETFGLAIAEAFACGTPVIASDLGAMRDLVKDGENGLLFSAGNSAELAKRIVWAQENEQAMAVLGANARRDFEAKLTAHQNYKTLMSIYARAIEDRR